MKINIEINIHEEKEHLYLDKLADVIYKSLKNKKRFTTY